MKISMIVISKGRLHHLQQTVASLVGQKFSEPIEYEVLVVDFGCPDGTFDWCRNQNLPRLRAVKVERDTMPFNKSLSRNFGAMCTNADWLMFVDVDLIVPHDLLSRSLEACLLRERKWLLPSVQGKAEFLDAENSRYRFPEAFEPGPPTTGNFVAVGKFVASDLFHAVRGYDESLPGWGYEDADLGLRLLRATTQGHYLIPANLIFLNHSEEDSVKFFENRNKSETAAKNLAQVEMYDRPINPHGYGQCDLADQWPRSSSFCQVPLPRPPR